MRSRSFKSLQKGKPAPPARLSNRYAAFGLLLVLASCSATQPASQFTARFTTEPFRGFQIQIYSTMERESAESMVKKAESWWEGLDDRERRGIFGVAYLPVEIKWLEPYYRVRLGHFRTREDARTVLGDIARVFPAAFIVPDTIL